MWMQVFITKLMHFVGTFNDYRHLDIKVHAEALKYN